jgi:hypothetical protein
VITGYDLIWLPIVIYLLFRVTKSIREIQSDFYIDKELTPSLILLKQFWVIWRHIALTVLIERPTKRNNELMQKL